MRISRISLKAFLLMIHVLISLQVQSQHRLVLINPTVGNIESMEWMIENKIIDIPGVELLGVYYAKEAYDYSVSEKYLSEHQLKDFHLFKIEGELKTEEIYCENSCTPAFRKLFEESDAILFFGGPDIPSAVYGEKQNMLTVVTDPYRHYFETSLFFHLIGGSRNPAFKPFLTGNPDFIIRAFCLGMQTMNVAAGGTLLQDIPTETYHKFTVQETISLPLNNQHRSAVTLQYPLLKIFDGVFHQITLTKTGYLGTIAAKSNVIFPKVLSKHHQAVGIMGANLEVMATSMDGKIIEGLQHAAYKNVVGVQFHPESTILFIPEKRVSTSPGQTISPNELLKKSNSVAFHQLFWKDFSVKIEKSRRPIKIRQEVM
jgi:putative glutamine amidotransferase